MLLMPVSRSFAARPRTLRALDPFNRFFDDAVERLLSPAAPREEAASPATPARAPAVDIHEADTAYVVVADLPGVAKEQVRIAVDGRHVTLEADAPAAAAREGERLVYRERSALRFERRFTLATDVDEAGATAVLDHGVLTLTLPKKVAAGPVRINVN